MASWPGRDIRVSVTLNPMILAEDLADVVVGVRTVSVAGALGASAGLFPRPCRHPQQGCQRRNDWVKATAQAGCNNQSRLRAAAFRLMAQHAKLPLVVTFEANRAEDRAYESSALCDN